MAFFMQQPLINILIRNKYRPVLFERCIQSVLRQTYKNYRILVACDSEAAYDQACNYTDGAFFVDPGERREHYWNLYCNDLKSFVHEGWFFYLDNDDYLATSTVLGDLAPHLRGYGAVIAQFLRNGRPKPNDSLMDHKVISKGRIGGGCMVLHHSFKDVADWDNQQAADFRWIEKVASVAPTLFVKIILQVAGNNGLHGK